jgi:MoeA N-terminal region (domain I and II)
MRVARDGGLSKNESGRAAPGWAVRSSPPFDAAGMDGIAVSAADTVRAGETTPVWLDEAAYDVVDTGDPTPDGRDAVVMREHVHYDDAGRAELRAAVAPYQRVRSLGLDDWVRVRLGPCCAIAGSRRRSRPSAVTRRARWAVARDGPSPATADCGGRQGARRSPRAAPYGLTHLPQVR